MDAFTTRNPEKRIKEVKNLSSPTFITFPTREFIESVAQQREKDDPNSFASVMRLFEITKDVGQICGPIQQISFADPFISADFKLFEVDKRLMEEITSPGGELVIRGRMTDFVVACTASKTYQVKECESSNSFLLLPQFQVIDDVFRCQEDAGRLDSASVCAISKTYLELTELSSTFSTRLRDILSQHVLDLTDETVPPKILSWTKLINDVQLSETQLRNELKKFPILECNDGFYLLSANSQQRILDEVVELCDDFFAPDVTTAKIDPTALKTKLPFPKELVEPIVGWFTKNFCDLLEDGIHLALNEEKLCRARASEILRADKNKDFPLDLFVRLVERVLPSGVACRVDCLRGIGFMGENLVTGKTIRSLEVEDLPDDARKRLEHLFALQPLWKKEDIQPYVIAFCAGSANIEEFLLKYCRILKKGDDKLFSLKQL